MQCPKCSNVNPPEAKFCGRCGERLAPPVPPIPPPPPPVAHNPVASEETVAEGLKIGIAVGSALFPILGIVMGIIFLTNPSPAKKKVGKLWLWIGIGAAILWFLYTQSN